jgi:hypothetical protein
VRQRHFDAFHLAVAAFGRRLKIVNELVKRYGLTDRLCAQLSEIKQGRYQEDREHVAPRKGGAGRNEDGLEGGHDCEKL